MISIDQRLSAVVRENDHPIKIKTLNWQVICITTPLKLSCVFTLTLLTYKICLIPMGFKGHIFQKGSKFGLCTKDYLCLQIIDFYPIMYVPCTHFTLTSHTLNGMLFAQIIGAN